MMFTFSKPEYLLLISIIPLLVFLHFIMLKRKRSQALRFANFDALARVKGVDLVSKNIAILVLSIAISLLIIFSLSGLTFHTWVDTSAYSYVIAIDNSRSMEATDFLPNRLEVAKGTAISFVDSLGPGTNVGVESFSGNAFIESEMSEDKADLSQVIKEIPVGSIGGTDLQEAVLTGANLLKGEDAKAIILISDGQINVGTIGDSIDYANAHDVSVFTIGVGTNEGGNTTYGFSKLDEDALKALSHNTGATYVHAGNERELSEAFTSLQSLKTKKASILLEKYLLCFALFLALLEYVLFNTRYRMFP